MIAEVLIPRPVYQAYSYRIPEQYQKEMQPGCRVAVSFGKQQLTGLIVAVCEGDETELKSLSGFMEPFPVVSEQQRDLIYWISSYYLEPPGEVASLFYLKQRFPSKTSWRLTRSSAELTEEISPRRKKLLEGLLAVSSQHGEQFISRSQFEKLSGLSTTLLLDSIKKGWIESQQTFPQMNSSDSSVFKKKTPLWLH
jgi:primosomal protein N' (replication factor Y)